MDMFLGFAALIITLLLSLFAALALDWLLLRGVFLIIEPATADRRVPTTRLDRGTQLAAQAYARNRSSDHRESTRFAG